MRGIGDLAINWERLLPFVIMITAFLAVVFLLLRELWLWYFRINDLNRKLDESNEHLKAIRAAIETQAPTEPRKWRADDDMPQRENPKKIPPIGNVDSPPAAAPSEWPD